MRLNNTSPANLIGRTIIFRNQYWEVASVDDDGLCLVKHGTRDKGRLRLQNLADCRLYLTHEEVRTKYARLVQALRWSGILTHTEAESCVLGYLTTGSYFMGSEAVAHMGGALAAIRHALRCRHVVQRGIRKDRLQAQAAKQRLRTPATLVMETA